MRYLIVVGRNLSPRNPWSRAFPRLKKVDPALYKEVMALTLRREIAFPENGYHPAKVWDLLQAEIQSRLEEQEESDPLVIVVTHSEAIVGLLGVEIDAQRIPREAVRILVIPEDESEALGLFTFDEAGYLRDPWPFGFFSWR